MRRTDGGRERGVGLLIVLVWLSLIASAALGVALATSAEAPASGALHERVRLTRGAESAAALALAALSPVVDWHVVPTAGLASPFVDGPPGPRPLGAVTLDLLAETWLRTCGRTVPCTDAATSVSTASRPWGVRNPRWRLVVHAPLADVDPIAGAACACYVVAWVADDPADDDGDPLLDAPAGLAGHEVLLVRGAAFGEAGGLAEVEALVAKPCRRGVAACTGIRVQSWSLAGGGAP
ncbi:MAG: hypothetical protein AB7O28_19910 [Vicinamibacterales bacterium]